MSSMSNWLIIIGLVVLIAIAVLYFTTDDGDGTATTDGTTGGETPTADPATEPAATAGN